MHDDRPAPSLPLACTLSASDGAERMERWRKLSERAQLSSGRLPYRVYVRFQDEFGIEAELTALAVAERECCPFLQFTVDRRSAYLELLVTATDGTDGALDQVASLFMGAQK